MAALEKFLLLGITVLVVSGSDAKLMLLAETSTNTTSHLALTVNCSYVQTWAGNVSNIVSLVLSQDTTISGDGNGTLKEIAFLNGFNPTVPHVVDQNVSLADGHIDLVQGSFLSVKWEHATEANEGRYHCTNNYVDELGQPGSIQSELYVTVPKERPISQLFDEIENKLKDLETKDKTLEIRVENLESKKQDNNTDIKILQENLKVLTARMDLIEQQQLNDSEKIKNLEMSTNDLKSAMFRISIERNNTKYFLSNYQPPHADDAAEVCKSLGGYLTEIDDLDEYNFIKTFLGGPWAAGESILLGGILDKATGRYVNRHSGTSLAIEDWHWGEPNHMDMEECLMLESRDRKTFHMNDQACQTGINFSYFYFLCEVKN